MVYDIVPYHIYLFRNLPPHVRPLRTGTESPGASAMFMNACIKESREELAYRHYSKLLYSLL